MKYKKFEDVSALLAELCLPFDLAEMREIAKLGAMMAYDEDFGRGYLLEVKNCYVRNFKALKEGTYEKGRFLELHESFLNESRQDKKRGAAMLPEYAKPAEDDAASIREKAAAIKGRLLKIKIEQRK